MIRRALFWLHLAAGVSAGIVILLLSATGVVLAFERQIVALAERDLRGSALEASMPPLPMSKLLAAATAAAPDGRPSSIVVRSDRLAPVAIAFGRERTLYLNRHTGAVLGEGARRTRRFLDGTRGLHRWLLMDGKSRDRGKAITGAANLAFLYIVLSGVVMWFPRRLTRVAFLRAGWFRRGMRGRARDLNWHHVFGVWAALPLAAIVISGVVMSYPWANRLVYRAFGSPPPPQQQAEGGDRPSGTIDLAALDRLWTSAFAEAARVAPRWQSMSVRLPFSRKGPVAFSVDEGNGARPDRRSQLLLDPDSGRVVEHKTYATQSAGQKARAWLRWIHTGEAGGLLGQSIAMFASTAAMVLVCTGLALALRRLARALRGAPALQPMLEE